jgi:hypothetical protein
MTTARFPAFTLLLAAAALGGCAKSTHQALQNSYHQDAAACRAQNPYQSRPAPGAANLDAVVSIDTQGYLGCMGKLGYRQDVKTDPLLKAIHRCESLATRTRAVTASGRQVGTVFDESAYRACMKERGFAAEANASH